MKKETLSTGKMGEELACGYLVRQGHTILARNWRSDHLEVDIISQDGDGLHIVEVKTRRLPAVASPEANVGPAKRQHLVKAAKAWLASDDRPPVAAGAELFFDIVSVEFAPDGEAKLRYYPQAFIPIYV